jgi:hypothetical protein
MGDKTRELILRLCTKAGTLMEDTSVLAVSASRLEGPAEIRERIDQLLGDALSIEACVRAAASLLE